jgi:hypothetical protein
MGEQVGGVGKAVAVAAHVTGGFETDFETLHILIGVIVRAEVRIHDGLHHLGGKIETGDVRDGNSHCC